jgi:hypothetical protein
VEIGAQGREERGQGMTFTIEDINDAWTDYTHRKVIKFLRDGKESFIYLEGQRVAMAGMINPQTVDLKTVISFPEYLRTKWTK